MKRFLLSAATTMALALPTMVVAQDFLGGLARSAAQSAAQGLANRAVSAVTSPRQPSTQPARPATTNAAQATAPAAAQATASGGGGLADDFPAPRPINYSPTFRDPSMLEFSQTDEAARIAFDQIGRYSCNDCEGGHSYDSWPRHEIRGIGVGNYELENRLGALKVGEALRWTGSRTRTQYAITVVSERGLAQWPCKQLKWTGDRGDQHVERMGMICKPTSNWHTAL